MEGVNEFRCWISYSPGLTQYQPGISREHAGGNFVSKFLTQKNEQKTLKSMPAIT
jgi:hypothetical protein